MPYYYYSLLLFLLSCHVLLAQPYDLPERPAKYRPVSDYAEVVEPSYADSISSLLSEFEKKSTAQIAIVSIQALPTNVSIEEYAIELARAWGIGQRGQDNGVLVIFAIKDRKIRIEVGYGLEALIPDLAAKKIINESLKPTFREERYGEGLYEACQILCDLLEKKLDAQAFIRPKLGNWWISILFFGISAFFVAIPFASATKSYIYSFLLIWFACCAWLTWAFIHFYEHLGMGNIILLYLLAVPLLLYLLMAFFVKLAKASEFIDTVKRDLGLRGGNAKLWQAMKAHFGTENIESKQQDFMQQALRIDKQTKQAERQPNEQKLLEEIRHFCQKPEIYFALLEKIKEAFKAEIEEKSFEMKYWQSVEQKEGKTAVKKAIHKLKHLYQTALDNEQKGSKQVKSGGFIYRFYCKYFRLLLDNPQALYELLVKPRKKYSTNTSSASQKTSARKNKTYWGFGGGGTSSSSSSSSSDWGGGDFGGGGASGDW